MAEIVCFVLFFPSFHDSTLFEGLDILKQRILKWRGVLPSYPCSMAFDLCRSFEFRANWNPKAPE